MSLWRPTSASVSEPRSSIDINSLGNITDVKLSISMLERIGKIIILGKMRHAWFSINFSKRKHSPIGILSRPPVMQETGVVSSRIHGKRRKCRKKMFFFSKVFWKGEEDIPKETFFMFFDHENREFFYVAKLQNMQCVFRLFFGTQKFTTWWYSRICHPGERTRRPQRSDDDTLEGKEETSVVEK